MKAIKILVLSMVLALAGTAQSQLSVNVQIGTAPAWGPRGYEHARYYYLPDVDAYYDINTAMFIYISGNSWIRRSYLPSRYSHYNLYRGRKVVMNNYHGHSPYYNHKAYRAKYGRGNQGVPQQNVNHRNDRNQMQGEHKSNIRRNQDLGNRRDTRNNMGRESNKNVGNNKDRGNGREVDKKKGNRNSSNR